MPFDTFNIFASSTAAIVARLTTHPLDTIKTRIQASPVPATISGVAIDLIRRESPLALYRGLPVAICFSVPALSTYLTVYDIAKDGFKSQLGISKDSVWNHLGSGCLAEVISGVIWTPMEVLKNRIQTESRGIDMTSSRTISLAKTIFKEEGIRGFFKGYFMALTVFVPYTMAYFATYEKLKYFARQYYYPSTPPSSITAQQPIPFKAYLISSALACTLAATISNLADVIKTRWQISSSIEGRAFYQGPRAILRRMWTEEGGWKILGKGIAARVGWAVPTAAISMAVFEVVKEGGNMKLD